MLAKLIIIIVAALAIGGYFLMQKGATFTHIAPQKDEVRTQWSQRKVACEGDFFDSHAHFDGLLSTNIFAPAHAKNSLIPQELAKRMSEHNVSCAILFIATPDMDKDFDHMRESLSDTKVGFLPFFPVFDTQQSVASVEQLSKIYQGREQAFFGIGEIHFYQGSPLAGTSLAANPWLAIFEYAAKENLFLMFHPTEREAKDLEKMLSKYPNTKVILHGFESLSTGLVGKWLLTYKNFYFTYDVATMLDGYLYRVQNGADFIKWYDANKSRYLTLVRSRLLPLLEAAPDQMMWGTDVVVAWHTEPEVYNRLMEFSKELVNSLPAQYRDNYANGNAQRLFSSGIVFEKP